jgi:uncharacterized LabA/DUF88 family protein
MKRAVVCVDAGYLFAQGSVALTKTKQRREFLVLDPARVLSELNAVVADKAPGSDILRIYWYDGALGLRPTLEQEQLAHLDNVKVRLGFINSAGQQKGVDSLIVTDLIELARLGAICDAVLLSGDEDVRVGVQIAQSYGVRVHVLGIEPSRGSQSKSLLQEADTTSEWDAATVAKFLSIRSVPAPSAAGAPAIITPPPPGTRTPTPPGAPSIPPTAGQLHNVAQEFANGLVEGDLKSLMAHWTTERGVPPEFDGRLLAKCRAEIGRDLDMIEKRSVRVAFADAVRAKVASLGS